MGTGVNSVGLPVLTSCYVFCMYRVLVFALARAEAKGACLLRLPGVVMYCFESARENHHSTLVLLYSGGLSLSPTSPIKLLLVVVYQWLFVFCLSYLRSVPLQYTFINRETDSSPLVTRPSSGFEQLKYWNILSTSQQKNAMCRVKSKEKRANIIVYSLEFHCQPSMELGCSCDHIGTLLRSTTKEHY